MSDGLPLFSTSHPRASFWRRIRNRLFPPNISERSIETFIHFHCHGVGHTAREAAYDFVQQLENDFPCKQGLYNFYLRVPIEYKTGKNYETGLEMYSYYLRGSFSEVEK